MLALIENNRSRIRAYLPKTAGSITDKASAKAYIKLKMQNSAERREFCFLITDLGSSQLCGAIFLKNFEWSVPKCELGYFIDSNYEGKGITSLAIKKIVSYCFSSMRLNKIFIRSALDNAASRMVAEKNGFKEEGIIRKDFMTERGELIDVVYYGLVNEDRL